MELENGLFKIYETDDKARWKYIKTDFKKHPKWKKRRLVRILMNLTILAGPLFWIKLELIEKTIQSISFDIMSFTVLFTCASLAAIPTMTYHMFLFATCNADVSRRANETLFLTDESLRLIYSRRVTDEIDQGREIFYRHIRRIVYNQYHNRIYIYGKVKCIYYKNYRRNPEDNTWYNDKKKSAHIRLTMIFHNNQEILEQIKKYSPVEIEVVNHPVEY